MIKSDQPTLVVTKWWYNQIFVDAIRGVVSMVFRRLSSVSMVSLRQFTSELRMFKYFPRYLKSASPRLLIFVLPMERLGLMGPK